MHTPAQPGYYAAAVPARSPSRWGADKGRRGTAWHWSPRCDTPAQARAEARRLVDSGEASLAFAVAVEPTGSHPLQSGGVYPASARKVVEHYEDLWGLLEGQP